MKSALMLLVVTIAVFLTSCNKNININNPVAEATPILAKQISTSNNWDVSTNFHAHLNGSTMLPPNNSKAQGEAIFHLSSDGNSIRYKLIVSNIYNVFMAHIHIGGSATQIGKIAVWLYGNPGDPISGLISGRYNGILADGTITNADLTGPLAGKSISDLVNDIRNGDAYVIVHTIQHKPGEIRGHIK